MGRLLKASLFKLKKDITFRVTLFIGIGLAIFMTLIYLIIDKAANIVADTTTFSILLCTGQNLLVSSLSPSQNFGIAIPVNLISFIVLEFNHGLIRNKVIAGNSKGKIYISLFVSGLIFTFIVMILYALLNLGLGAIFGGFNPNGAILHGTFMGYCNPEFLFKTILATLFIYIFITSFTIFLATSIRSIGPCIPIVILTILMLFLVSTILPSISKNSAEVLRIINPLHILSSSSVNTDTHALYYTNEVFYPCLISNSIYAAIFFTVGFLIFRKRDIK